MGKKNEGKVFEESFQTSAKEQGVYIHRIKDQFIPVELRQKMKVTKNPFDSIMFHEGMLFLLELKSTKGKSFSFDEKIIKQHQIDSLEDAAKHEGVYPGFLFNFREPENKVYFVHIDDFLRYKRTAEGKLKNFYEARINKSSIPIAICEEIGIEVKCMKKKVKYRYYVKEFIDKLISHKDNPCSHMFVSKDGENIV